MAITKKQVQQKTDELIRDLAETFKEKVKVALNSGAIDLEQYDNNFQLPKIIITAILKSNTELYCHPAWRDYYCYKKEAREINNLQRFV